MFIIPVLIIAIVLITVGFIAALYLLNGRKIKRSPIKKTHDLPSAIKEASRRIARNPRDAAALMFIGDQQFQNEEWEKAADVYGTLAEMSSSTREVDMTLVNLRAAICAAKQNMLDSAFRYIAVAHSLDPKNFEVAYQMGNIEFLRNSYDKAVKYLQQSISLNAQYAPTLRLLGYAYYKLKRFKEAVAYIRKSMDISPDDKESLFILAECYSEMGQKDKAVRIYSHLRPDPIWGAEACLQSGMININSHNDGQAIKDFEIGLKHRSIKPSIAVEIHYQLGAAYLNAKMIQEALGHLKAVQKLIQNYKDTNELVARYGELGANKNLQIYTMSSCAEFIALCRKIVLGYFPKANVKIIKTQATGNDWVDITSEVDTSKWSDLIMFRFVRTNKATGEDVLRDFHSHIKEIKAGKGICVSSGVFTEDAKRFTSARLIDLIEKEEFLAIIKSVDSLVIASPPAPTSPPAH
jgi:tetratricopeptide (TPR) repeat protein